MYITITEEQYYNVPVQVRPLESKLYPLLQLQL